jgi:imidazoleglycerol-phosphate dehydratase
VLSFALHFIMARTAVLKRDTNETMIQVHWIIRELKKIALSLDGGELPSLENAKAPTNGESGHATQATASQTIEVNTGIGFLDHVYHLCMC